MYVLYELGSANADPAAVHPSRKAPWPRRYSGASDGTAGPGAGPRPGRHGVIVVATGSPTALAKPSGVTTTVAHKARILCLRIIISPSPAVRPQNRTSMALPIEPFL
jgi:hypothetical protein